MRSTLPHAGPSLARRRTPRTPARAAVLAGVIASVLAIAPIGWPARADEASVPPASGTRGAASGPLAVSVAAPPETASPTTAPAAGPGGVKPGDATGPRAPDPASAGAGACDIPSEFTTAPERLEHVAAALHAGGTLDILALGSASLLGAVGDGQTSFPFLMADQLRAAAPGAVVRLTVRSGRGMTAADMLALLRKELSEHPHQLVLWQTGTVEAVRNLPSDEFYETLADGAATAQAAGADIVLIDPQYSRFLRANADLDPYELTMAQAAGLQGVGLFRRYDLMRAWVSSGQIDLERASRADRKSTVEHLHDCLGRALAAFVIAATKPPTSD